LSISLDLLILNKERSFLLVRKREKKRKKSLKEKKSQRRQRKLPLLSLLVFLLSFLLSLKLPPLNKSLLLQPPREQFSLEQKRQCSLSRRKKRIKKTKILMNRLKTMMILMMILMMTLMRMKMGKKRKKKPLPLRNT